MRKIAKTMANKHRPPKARVNLKMKIYSTVSGEDDASHAIAMSRPASVHHRSTPSFNLCKWGLLEARSATKCDV